MLPSGYCRIIGRIKDMLIRGGENIYPREVEEVLNTHPNILEAYVFGVPDSRLGEEVAAWVRTNNEGFTEDHILTFLKGKVSLVFDLIT